MVGVLKMMIINLLGNIFLVFILSAPELLENRKIPIFLGREKFIMLFIWRIILFVSFVLIVVGYRFNHYIVASNGLFIFVLMLLKSWNTYWTCDYCGKRFGWKMWLPFVTKCPKCGEKIITIPYHKI